MSSLLNSTLNDLSCRVDIDRLEIGRRFGELKNGQIAARIDGQVSTHFEFLSVAELSEYLDCIFDNVVVRHHLALAVDREAADMRIRSPLRSTTEIKTAASLTD